VRIRGICRASFAWDIGLSIDLARAEERLPISKNRVVLRHRGRAYPMDTRVLPLRLSLHRDPVQVGARHTSPRVEVVLFDYGAVSIAYTIELDCDLTELPELSDILYDHPGLHIDARATAEQLLAMLDDAVTRPGIAPVVEDYVVFHLDGAGMDGPLSALWEDHADVVAAALRSATEPLSPDEVADALSLRVSYGVGDVVIVDWFAAIVVGPEMEDEIAVLEFATVELLELRMLDRRLDDDLDAAYELLRAGTPPRWKLFPGGAGVARVATLQTDAAMVLEGATNPAKLLGDQYLARMYRLVAMRFHLAEWEAAVDRKLSTLDSVYQKLADAAATRRLETLEWIIILLIAVSIAVYFLP